jgi:hypothetical protein
VYHDSQKIVFLCMRLRTVEYIVFVCILLKHLERGGGDTLGMRLAIVIAWPETSMIAPRGHC